MISALIGIGLFACNDDDEIGFDVPTEFRDIQFEPLPGGALMRYYLPDESEIFGVQVRYKNAWGEERMKNGTYLSDTLLLDGFTEAQQGVPVEITFINRDMAESNPIQMTFDTEKSAAVAVFDSLTVNSFWGGFNVTYSAPEMVSGLIHIFYIGNNPLTNEPDSILMTSVPIVEGGDTLNFVLQQVMDSVDIVVRTDSYDGHRVKQRVVKGLPCLTMDTITPADFDFRFTGPILENEEFEFGEQYLFDGDKLGLQRRANILANNRYKYSTFVAGPAAFYDGDYPDENRFIVDLRTERVPAAVNLYAYIYLGGGYPYKNENYPLPSTVWSGHYYTRLPAKIRLYGTNDDPETTPLSECAHLFTLDENINGCFADDCWAALTDSEYSVANYKVWGSGTSQGYLGVSDSEAEKAPPVVLNMLCNYTGAKYRYLIFVVDDTFNSDRYGEEYEENAAQYVTINELEVCVKKDEE